MTRTNQPAESVRWAPGLNAVKFRSQGYEIAAHVYLPDGLDLGSLYPAVVFCSPGMSVKEQSGAVYGRALSDRGYAVLTFDRLGFGESEGPFPRCLNPGPNDELHHDAISFLRSLPFVDRSRFYGLGVCVGGIDVTKAAISDKRLIAIATISAIVGAAQRFFAQDRETVEQALAAAAEVRQRQYETGEMVYADSISNQEAVRELPESDTVRQGVEYYKGLASAEAYPGYSTLSPTSYTEAMPSFDVLSLAKYLYTPYLGVIGSKADTRGDTEDLYAAASDPKELLVVDGASHVDLYHRQPYVAEAVRRIDEFFSAHSSKSFAAS